MAITEILVHIDSSQSCEKRVQAAIHVAQRHAAHLTGVYVMPFDADLLMYPVEPIAPRVMESIKKPLLERRDTARTLFETFTASAGLATEWREIEGGIIPAINASACYADLVILGQYHPEDGADKTEGVVDHVVLGSGRPCLVLPYSGAPPTIGTRVLIAWNAGREATRAVHDALPILQTAEHVSVLAVDPPSGPGGEEPIPCADICQHLARHEVQAEAQSRSAPASEVGNLLLSHAADQGINLIVMGAYGHSRLREAVLGSVTRSLLHQMTVPVFMSH